MRVRILVLHQVRGLSVLTVFLAVVGVGVCVDMVACSPGCSTCGPAVERLVVRPTRGRPRALAAAGSVVARPDARWLARAAWVSAIVRRSSKVGDAPQPPTWRTNCR